ncbi:MAG: hypothetical protein MJZ75_06830 [Paludibacteraceae bacterium]|nr:hypothetical protein [Paludibacteraceae bacterium]
MPISKSIANRLLILQAMHGDPLLEVSCDMPEDVQILYNALLQIWDDDNYSMQTVDCRNCGTAMRFLTAYCAQLTNCEVILDGCERMRQRPIGQLVDALRQCGAQIEYKGEEGFPPIYIKGTRLQALPVTVNNPLSTQFVSALMLIGIPVTTDCTSPYIDMTAHMLRTYPDCPLERDWSSAAFWYEYVALHGESVLLRDLSCFSRQGDKVVKKIFLPLGVKTTHRKVGEVLTRICRDNQLPQAVDFTDCPDLYPAVAMTYRQINAPLDAIGIDRLQYKESDRLQSMQTLQTNDDHRMAMALLAADLPCDNTDCIAKSYPSFITQLQLCKKK